MQSRAEIIEIRIDHGNREERQQERKGLTADSEHGDRALALKLQELRATPVAFRRSIRKSHTFTVLPAAHRRRGEPIVGELVA